MIRKIFKKFVPNFILDYKKKYITNQVRKKFSKMDQYEVFKEIYLKKLWSEESSKLNHKFYSGVGSHLPELTNDYVIAIQKFLKTFPTKPNVVDLGCGDFIIGSKLRQMCNNYTAIDIFDELINFNKEKYKDLNVNFKVLDMTKNELPASDICFVRQVLQHLSNESIQNFINNAKNKYKYFIVTEHYPPVKNFVMNVDKPTGPDTRFYDKSAVVLTAPPFNLKVIKDIDICETTSDSVEGVLKTKVLQLEK